MSVFEEGTVQSILASAAPHVGALTPGRVDPPEAALRGVLAGLDVEALARRFREDDGLIVLPHLVPPALIDAMESEARRLLPRARRTFVPFVRKAEAVGHFDIAERAPTLHALHQSPSLLAFCQRIAGPELEHRKPNDPHASGLYLYNRRGDHVGWHFDDCGCEAAASFTVLASVANASATRLDVELHRKTPGRPTERRSIDTAPGTLTFLRGSSVYHRVAPIRGGQERLSFSFVYVKKGFHPKGFDRLWQSTLDTLLYFGWRGVPRR